MGILDYIKNLFKSNKKIARIIAQDLSKTQGAKDQLEIGLYENKTPLINKEITININGVDYIRKTNDDGIAKLNINLGVGEYDTHITFNDQEYEKTSTYCKVTILPVLITNDLTMMEHDGSKFTAYTESINGDKLGNVKITFNINGIDYNRTTDINGAASLNINLNAGDYKIKTSCLNTVKENTIHISSEPLKKTWMEGTDVNKTFGDSTPYQCAVYSDEGRISGTVKITINGVTYERTPNSEGLYKLNINLNPGTYNIKADFVGDNKHLPSSVSNTVVVNEVKPEPQKSRSEKILDYFESRFGTTEYIDDALAKIKGRGYKFYFSDGYNMYETIDRVYERKGANCFDIAEVLYHLAKGMNTKYGRKYEVWYLDVWCPVSGYDHIRLRLRSNNGNYFYRDGACVLDGGDISSNWCGTSNNILEVNPSWIYDGD